MIDVRYRIRGHDLFDVNPEFISDLERVTSTLFCVSVFFPDYNTYEEGFELMHGIDKAGGVIPESYWAKARFRFDGETKIESLQGIIFRSNQGGSSFLQLAEDIPEIARGIKAEAYEPNKVWDISMVNLRGQSVTQMDIDRGHDYDTLKLRFSNGSEMISVYKAGTFIGFQIDETTGHGIKSAHYVLEDVDPSIYVSGFIECSTERKDVLYNEGLQGGTVRPLLVGSKTAYREPDQERVQVTEANEGDQYVIIFKADTPEEAQNVYQSFRKMWEDDSETGSDAPFDLEDFAAHMGPNVTIGNVPTFAVDLTKDRKPESKYYGLTLTTLSSGQFETQNDVRDLIQGYIVGLKKPEHIEDMHLI